MNPGDLFAKGSLTAHRIQMLFGLLGCAYRTGRALSAPTLRIAASTQLSTKVQWGDYNDKGSEEEHGEEEVTSMLKCAGLPHAHRSRYQPEKSKEAYPENEESEDKMEKEGEALGKQQRGRGGLPERPLAKRSTRRKE